MAVTGSVESNKMEMMFLATVGLHKTTLWGTSLNGTEMAGLSITEMKAASLLELVL